MTCPAAMAATTFSRMPGRTSSIGPATVNPAAFLWPPPPKVLATSRTSTSYFERMLTRTAPSGVTLKNTTA